MKFDKVASIFISAVIGCGLCVLLFAAKPANATVLNLTPNKSISTKTPNKKAELDGLPLPALKAAINGYRYAVDHHDVNNTRVLTIIDFDKPSYQRRLWVIDLHNDHVIMHMHVTQGHDGGKIHAEYFSNAPHSHESSPGLFTTVGDRYNGEHGESLRIRGLEEGINNNVYSRAIVIHGAWYATSSFIDNKGYAGRSWGCFAINPNNVSRLIQLTRDGSVLFAYAKPEKEDALVNHRLSYRGQKMYDAITNTNSNPIVRFFEML